MERAFIEFLNHRPQIVALASGGFHTMMAPPSTQGPRVVIQEIDSSPMNTQDGFGSQRTSTLQIKAIAARYDDAKTLARLIEAHVDKFCGRYPPSRALIGSALPQGMRDLPPERPQGSNILMLYSAVQDWAVHWSLPSEV